MKKIVVLFLLFITISIKAQLFLTLNPMQGHFIPGVVVNSNPIEKLNIGYYGNVMHGNINYIDEFGSYSSEQLKFGAGLSYKFNKYTMMLGINRSKFYNTNNSTFLINPNKHYNLSFDIGGFIILPTNYGDIKFLAITDPLNWESQLGFSINLKKQ